MLSQLVVGVGVMTSLVLRRNQVNVAVDVVLYWRRLVLNDDDGQNLWCTKNCIEANAFAESLMCDRQYLNLFSTRENVVGG